MLNDDSENEKSRGRRANEYDVSLYRIPFFFSSSFEPTNMRDQGASVIPRTSPPFIFEVIAIF